MRKIFLQVIFIFIHAVEIMVFRRIALASRRHLLLFIFISSSQVAFSQFPQKDFYFNHIKTEQGLSNGIVNDMLKDKSGFMWIATLNGLNRFDGAHFMVYKADPRDSTKLSSDAIYGLCEDSEGNIWCAHNSGISRYNRRKNIFKNYTLTNAVTGLRSVGSSNGILYTKRGDIVTYSNSGVFVYDKDKDGFVYYTELTAEGRMECDAIYNKSFLEDRTRNGIWIGTDNGLKYFDLDSRKFFGFKNNPEKNILFNDHSCRALTYDNEGSLVYFDNNEKAIMTYSFASGMVSQRFGKIPVSDEERINCILIDSNSNAWMSVHSMKVLYFDNSTEKIYNVRHQPGLSHTISGDYFNCALQDSLGNIYIGTVNGINYFNLYQDFVSIISFPDSIAHRRQYYLHQLLNGDKQNNIWFAPTYQYLLKYNPGSQSFQTFDLLKSKAIPGDINISAMEATNDKLYFGTLDGIYTYEVSTSTFDKLRKIPASEKIDGKYILCMMLTSKGDLWFTSHHNGVFRYNTNTGKYFHYVPDSTQAGAFSNEYIFDMLEDRSGNVWFCAENDGLIKFSYQKNSFEYFTKNASASNPEVYYSIVCDKQNNLWVQGILSGLNKFDTKTNTFSKDIPFKGLSNFQYNHLLEDGRNRIWLSYYSQYSVLDINKTSVKNFEINYARANNDYANYSCLMADGRIAAESRNGFFIFNPDKYEDHKAIEAITISDFSVNQVQSPFIAGDSIIHLKSSQNFFSINFSTLSLLNNSDIQFAYKLEGLNDYWVECGNRHTAYFTNLGGGEYSFKVKATAANGMMRESAYPARISIDKVFYSTIWFRLVLLAALGGCITWYISIVRKRRLKKDADKAIAYFANSLQGKNKVEELLWDITHNVITRTNMVDCVVYLLDKEHKVLVQKAAFGEKNPGEYEILNPLEIPLGKGIVGNVAETGVAEIVPDTSKDPRYIADDSMRLSELAVPIIAEGQVIGVIDSEHPDRNFFTREHLYLMKTIASITATKIVRAQKEMEVEANRERLEDLKTQVTQTRQQALQAQMNPHFIFNCLNSINGFILQNDPATASTFLIKFSKLIRLILEHSNEKTISLLSELEALKLYIDMESLRFGKKFSFKIEVDKSVMADSIQVPPLILQPFVENSIWHGLLHKQTEGVLKIDIAMKGNMLECIIEDNGVGRAMSASFKTKTSVNKKSLGLKLTNERLALMYPDGNRRSAVRVIDMQDNEGIAAGTKVIISMPIAEELN